MRHSKYLVLIAALLISLTASADPFDCCIQHRWVGLCKTTDGGFKSDTEIYCPSRVECVNIMQLRYPCIRQKTVCVKGSGKFPIREEAQ